MTTRFGAVRPENGPVSTCVHLVNVSLVTGTSVHTQFKLIRSVCRLKETDRSRCEQMNLEHRDRMEPAAAPEECPFAGRGDFGSCHWCES